jgi:hypothetical protein
LSGTYLALLITQKIEMIIIIGFQYIVAMYIVGNISKFAKKNPFRAIAH